jgi:hypothetical protein
VSWPGASGAADQQGVADAEGFRQKLRVRQPDVPLTLTRGAGHTLAAWRAEVPSMLTWMTPGLARAADEQAAAHAGETPILAAR